MKIRSAIAATAIAGASLVATAPIASASPAQAFSSKMECTPTLPVGPRLCAKVYGVGLYVDEVFFAVSAAPGNPWVGRVWYQMRPYAVEGKPTVTISRQSRSGHANEEECIIFSGYINVHEMLSRNGRWKVGAWSAPYSPETIHVLEGTVHR